MSPPTSRIDAAIDSTTRRSRSPTTKPPVERPFWLSARLAADVRALPRAAGSVRSRFASNGSSSSKASMTVVSSPVSLSRRVSRAARARRRARPARTRAPQPATAAEATACLSSAPAFLATLSAFGRDVSPSQTGKVIGPLSVAAAEWRRSARSASMPGKISIVTSSVMSSAASSSLRVTELARGLRRGDRRARRGTARAA